MRTNFFLVCTMLFVFFNASGQTNTVISWNNPSPGKDNVSIGNESGININNVPTVFGNTFVGVRSGKANTSGIGNCFYGYQTGLINSTGSNNTFYGRSSGAGNISGNSNTYLGYASGYASTGNNNTFTGFNSGYQASGNGNTFSGHSSGSQNIGSNNVFLGLEAGKSSGSSSNSIFIGYQAGLTETANNRLYIQNSLATNPLIYGEFDNRNLSFNVSNNSSSRVSITSGVPYVAGAIGLAGLRFTNLRSGNAVNANLSASKVLSVDANGDVILVNDQLGGITQNCSTANFVPVNSSTAGQLNCSQIFDNGTSVGIGTGTQLASYFNYTYAAGDDAIGVVGLSGTARLRVNGVTWSGGFYATSDKKFKKDIKPIENAIDIVQKIDGKTYFWDGKANKSMNFDAGEHSGFIAQDLEKVLPHLVATSQDGEKAVNYTELIPYLVEAIKEQNSLIKNQQNQIDELKNQISDNFKAQNNELIQLENTKIISVSPNPSNDFISVSLNIEKSVQTASLQVHDLNGKLLNNLTISNRENNITRTLQKDNFGAGVYVVSLVVNGKSIDSKKVIFN